MSASEMDEVQIIFNQKHLYFWGALPMNAENPRYFINRIFKFNPIY